MKYTYFRLIWKSEDIIIPSYSKLADYRKDVVLVNELAYVYNSGVARILDWGGGPDGAKRVNEQCGSRVFKRGFVIIGAIVARVWVAIHSRKKIDPYTLGGHSRIIFDLADILLSKFFLLLIIRVCFL